MTPRYEAGVREFLRRASLIRLSQVAGRRGHEGRSETVAINPMMMAGGTGPTVIVPNNANTQLRDRIG